MRRPLWFIILVLLGVAVDLLAKTAAFNYLPPPPKPLAIIPEVLHLVQAKNKGVAFSLLAGYPSLIYAVSVAAIAAMLWIYARIWRRAARLTILALGLLLVGASGNLVDRAQLGYVRDFIDFVPKLPIVDHWAVFNLADMCIVVGMGLLLIHEFFLKERTA